MEQKQQFKHDEFKEGKYLTFTLAEEEFGIRIIKVKEIIGMMQCTPIPRVPDFIKGVINLRGKVIPVLDLRLKFNMEAVPYDQRTCIVVVEVQVPNGVIPMGVVVDAVNEVVNIKEEEVEDPPDFGTAVDTNYIMGMAKTEKDVKILLDIDKVLTASDVVTLVEAA